MQLIAAKRALLCLGVSLYVFSLILFPILALAVGQDAAGSMLLLSLIFAHFLISTVLYLAERIFRMPALLEERRRIGASLLLQLIGYDLFFISWVLVWGNSLE